MTDSKSDQELDQDQAQDEELVPDAEATADAEPEPEPVEEVPIAAEAEDAEELVAAALAPEPVEPEAPRPYAIVETGGKQYRVRVGDRISVERLPGEEGGEITLDRVLLIGGDGSTRVGTPLVPGATVTAQVDDHFRGEKIVVFKYKPKKRYRRRTGHRQSLTHLTITNISL